jgi:hypothetical protein
MKLATNQTAQAYDRLQRSINWVTASNESQLNVMEVMKQLLIQAKSNEAIFDYGVNLIDGTRSVRTVAEQLNYIMNRISRIKRG